MYENHREELQSEFRNAKKSMRDLNQVFRGFFRDPRHLGRHFEYLAGAAALDNNLALNLQGFLSKYLDYSLKYSICNFQVTWSYTYAMWIKQLRLNVIWKTSSWFVILNLMVLYF